MLNENDKVKNSMKDIEEKAKEFKESTRKTMENIEKDVKETLEASDRQRADIVDEMMTPFEEDEDVKKAIEEIEQNNENKKDINEEPNKPEEGITYGSVKYNKGKLEYKPCKIVKSLDITSKIILVLAIISMVIIAMQKQPVLGTFGQYTGYEWQPISLAYGLISGFSGYVFYILVNAASKLIDDINKNRQLKEFEILSKLQENENN